MKFKFKEKQPVLFMDSDEKWHEGIYAGPSIMDEKYAVVQKNSDGLLTRASIDQIIPKDADKVPESNPNIAFKRKKNKERRRPAPVRVRNPARNIGVTIKPRINVSKVESVRRSTDVGVRESIKALKREDGNVRNAIAYIRSKEI